MPLVPPQPMGGLRIAAHLLMLTVSAHARMGAWLQHGGNENGANSRPINRRVPGLSLRWAARTRSTVSTQTIVVNNSVIFPEWSGTLRAVTTTDGKPRWHAKIFDGGPGPGETQPAVVDGKVIMAAANWNRGRAMVWAFDATTGRLSWKRSMSLTSQAQLGHRGIRTYRTSSNEAVAVIPYTDTLLAVSAKDGRELWRFTSAAPAASSAFLDPRGPLGVAGAVSEPSIQDGMLYTTQHTVTGVDFVVLDASSGAEVLRRSIVTHGPVGGTTNIVAAGAQVFVAFAGDSKVYALSTDGALMFTANVTSGVFQRGFAVGRECIIVSVAPAFVVCIDRGTGAVGWKRRLLNSTGSTPSLSQPLIVGDVVLISGGKRMFALSLHAGDVRWTFSARSELRAPAAIAGNKVFWPVTYGHRVLAFDLEPDPQRNAEPLTTPEATYGPGSTSLVALPSQAAASPLPERTPQRPMVVPTHTAVSSAQVPTATRTEASASSGRHADLQAPSRPVEHMGSPAPPAAPTRAQAPTMSVDASSRAMVQIALLCALVAACATGGGMFLGWRLGLAWMRTAVAGAPYGEAMRTPSGVGYIKVQAGARDAACS